MKKIIILAVCLLTMISISGCSSKVQKEKLPGEVDKIIGDYERSILNMDSDERHLEITVGDNIFYAYKNVKKDKDINTINYYTTKKDKAIVIYSKDNNINESNYKKCDKEYKPLVNQFDSFLKDKKISYNEFKEWVVYVLEKAEAYDDIDE